MPHKNKKKSEGKKKPNSVPAAVREEDDPSIEQCSVASNYDSNDDVLSVASSSMAMQEDDVQSEEQATEAVLNLLGDYMEQLSERSSKTRAQTRIHCAKQALTAMRRFCLHEILQEQWAGKVDSFMDLLAHLLRRSAKEEEATLALQCACVWSVQVCDSARVSKWLSTDGWLELLLVMIQDAGNYPPQVQCAAIHTLATMHLTSDFHNSGDLLRCMLVLENIYQGALKPVSGGNNNNGGEQHRLHRAALLNWALLYCSLARQDAQVVGRAHVPFLLRLLLKPSTEARLCMVAGQCLALICEKLAFIDPSGGLAFTALASDEDGGPQQQYHVLMAKLEALSKSSRRSLSHEIRRDLRACFRLVHESVHRDLGSRAGADPRRALTTDEYQMNIEVNEEHESDEDEVEEEEEDEEDMEDEEEMEDEDEDDEEDLGTTPAARPQWQQGAERILRLGTVKLALTGETVYLQQWEQKLFYDTLSDTLKGGLSQHLQFNPMVRELFRLYGTPRAALLQDARLGGGSGEGDTKLSKSHRRRLIEMDRKGNQMRRQKDRQMRDQRLGRQSSLSEQ